jgi:undecaprenyl phosphate-alpha-L-ara4N flippase subunit ArnE
MNPLTALWASIVLGSCAQVFLRRGVAQRLGPATGSYLLLLRSPWVWAWAACFIIATGLWMIAISSMQVSYAFPLLSIGYLVVAVLSMAFLKERIPAPRWLAIAVITLGVALIFRSS